MAHELAGEIVRVVLWTNDETLGNEGDESCYCAHLGSMRFRRPSSQAGKSSASRPAHAAQSIQTEGDTINKSHLLVADSVQLSTEANERLTTADSHP